MPDDEQILYSIPGIPGHTTWVEVKQESRKQVITVRRKAR